MPFDLSAVQHDIRNYLRTTFPQYQFFTSSVPEDDEMPRVGDEVLPFFVLQFGPLWPRPRGKSIKGPRNDDYFSWVQIIAVASVEERAADAVALVTDYLIGYKPVGATSLIPDGGMSDYGSRQYSVRPVMYYQSQRFEFGITQSGLDGRIPLTNP